MRSSNDQYFIALDHIRALAALLVFSWHFIHPTYGESAQPAAFPLSIFSEGHTGVALFMALSGYLFAKLLNGHQIHYRAFLWNRLIRLAPLLIAVVAVVGARRAMAGADMMVYLKSVLFGLVQPTLPNGGWSITAEFHFYLVLPLLLALNRTWRPALPLFLGAVLLMRVFLYGWYGEIQFLSYWTIVGRIDQFLLGILAFQYRHRFTGRHLWMATIGVAFLIFYNWFDRQGGFLAYPDYPSDASLWIWMPTIEGLVYACSIAWYDTSFRHSGGWLSRVVALIGTCSYSIYLLHFFFVGKLAHALQTYTSFELSTTSLVLLAPFAFLLVVPVAYLSYRFVELPFLRFRTPYIQRND